MQTNSEEEIQSEVSDTLSRNVLGHRGKSEIIADILSTISSGPRPVTLAMNHSNLSFSHMNIYVKALEKLKLARQVDEDDVDYLTCRSIYGQAKRFLVITELGIEYLSRHEWFRRLFSEGRN
ncbi:MAG: winged helix-turn-helix domain-containing protein [Nitrososphaerales archaeon]